MAVAVALTLTPGPATAPVVKPAGWNGTAYTIVAHRCNGSVYTEQTSVGCVKAAAKGATYLEGDIRFTSTGIPVMLHNPDMGVFGAPSVLIANITTTQAFQYVSPLNQNIMTLQQFKDLAVATDSDMVVEPKVRPTAAQWDAIDARLGGIKDRVLMNSFDRLTIADAAARGYTWLGMSTTNDPTFPLPVGLDVVFENAANIDAATVAAVKAAGAEVWCYVCDDPTSWAAMAALGVTGFSTDDHAGAQVWALANPTPPAASPTTRPPTTTTTTTTTPPTTDPPPPPPATITTTAPVFTGS
jgi:glycerophosphoryl diester phosphodiesterase